MMMMTTTSTTIPLIGIVTQSHRLPKDAIVKSEKKAVRSEHPHPVACENIHFSTLFASGDVSRRGTSATQRQKFHTDDANQCLHNKSGSHGLPNTNWSNFTCLLVDFGEMLCLSANDLQQNSNASSREEFIPQILTILLEILCAYL